MAATELRIFTAAMTVETAHLLDDGLWHPHDGVTDVPSALISVAMGIVAVLLYARVGRRTRVLVAGLFGLAGLFGGLDMHVAHALQDGASGSDYTGFGQVVAGSMLLVLAAVVALRPVSQPQPTAAG
jgi:hypothetical protein